MNSFDKDQLRNVFFDNYEPLKRKAFHILGDNEAAEDVVQDVFIQVWKKGTSNAIKNPRAYFNRAVVNTALNHLEKHKKLLLFDPKALPEASENTTDHTLALTELEEKLQSALNELSPQRKVIFSLSLFENMSNAEIAEELGVAKKTVDNQLGTALKQLRERLAAYLKLLVEFLPVASSLLFFMGT